MTFSWLPHSERYRHPRLSWMIECGFDVITRAMYRLEGINARDRPAPEGALVVSNHQRDSDVPVLATFLCRRRGRRILDPLPYFATREDLFGPGALRTLLASWPTPLPQLLGHISLNWLLQNVRARPMRRIAEFSWAETVQALRDAGQGDADPALLFNARGRRELAAHMGTLPARLADLSPQRLGSLGATRWGLRRLRLPVLRRLSPGFRDAIGMQLDRFAALLEQGERVYFSPEGCISPHGTFGRVRSGAWQLCQRSRSDVPVLPCTISYDALAPGRLRAVVYVGQVRRDLQDLDAATFAARLREIILAQCPVTASHMLARFLCHGPKQFSTAQVGDWLARETASARASGLVVDPLLERTDPQALAAQRLRWLRRRRVVARAGDGWRNDWSADVAPGWHDTAAIVRYLANSLEDLSPQQAWEQAA